MVNRQYPNNGFINNIDVTESMYDSEDKDKDGVIPEDLRDLINETIQEVYKDVAIDEVFSFPTVPGQNQYVLPEDCDLRDIQEVTRTFVGVRGPLRPPFPPRPGGEIEVTFRVSPDEGNIDGEPKKNYFVAPGETLKELPTVTAYEGYTFIGWTIDGIDIIPDERILATPVIGPTTYTGVFEGDEKMTNLTEDLVLRPYQPTLTIRSGFYFTGPYKVYIQEPYTDPVDVLGNYSTFYYDEGTNTISSGYINARYDNASEGWKAVAVEPLGTAVNNAGSVSAITAQLNPAETVTLGETGEAVLPLTALQSTGDGFTIENGDEVVVGSGIDYVVISAQVVWDSTVASPSAKRDVAIRITSADEVYVAGKEEYNQSISPFVYHVTEGTTIELVVYGEEGDVIVSYGGTGGVCQETYLSVQQVKTPQ